MLITNFKNYDEYREMFYREDGKRKNKILLDFLRCKEVHNFYAYSRRYKHQRMKVSMVDLFDYCMSKISRSRVYNPSGNGGIIEMLGYAFTSRTYYCDERKGVCHDGDIQSYRYARLDNHRVYKMKVGKLFAQIIEDTEWGRLLPQSVKIYLCEEVTKRWKAERLEEESKYELHYGSSLTDFRRIYNYYDDCACGFGSCMSGGSHAGFYTDAVDATAAWIKDTETNEIVARCVIYDKVKTCDGSIIRLAERQYAEDEKDYLKTILINKLIKEDMIDGYKAIGADCHDASNFLDVDGKKFEDTDFSIECRLDYEDTLSYQDSFKWYDIDKNIAYNYHEDYADISLDETDATLYDPRDYDEYHNERGFFDLVSVYTRNGRMHCNASRLEDFRLIEGDWYHKNLCRECDCCGSDALKSDGYYSEDGERFYCCLHCFDENENEDEDE